jgi:hypothetical protein
MIFQAFSFCTKFVFKLRWTLFNDSQAYAYKYYYSFSKQMIKHWKHVWIELIYFVEKIKG